VSTAGDYHRFLRMMLNKGELDGKRLLKAETVAKMTTDQVRAGDMKFSYGFRVLGAPKGAGPSAGSYTWGGFFYTYLWVDPKQEVIGVLMTQLHPSEGLKLPQEFMRLVYQGLGK